MGRLLDDGEAPICPVCDGPCTEEFERSENVVPDRLPQAEDGSADPEPVKPARVNRRGRRAHRLAEDRMHRPSEDR